MFLAVFNITLNMLGMKSLYGYFFYIKL